MPMKRWTNSGRWEPNGKEKRRKFR